MPVLVAVDIRELESRAESLAASLPEERREAMRRFRFRADRLRCLAAGLLMREAVADRRILRGEWEKPYVPGGPFFNVSHSGEYTVLAAGEREVGVDIEAHREAEYARLAEVSFHPGERRLLAENYECRFFYDLWALKESYMKMTGKGFFLDPAGFCLDFDGRDARLKGAEEPAPRFRLYGDIPGYSLAVCVEGGGLPEGVSWFRP